MSRMRSRYQKIAITLPDDLLQRVESLRSETAETRSGLIRRAIEALLEDLERSARIAEYVEGYGEHPETAKEVDAAEAAATELLAQERWE